MPVVIFGNSMKQGVCEGVKNLLTRLSRRGEKQISLSQELRVECDLRDYPAFDSTTVAPNTIAFSFGGDGTFLNTASIIGNSGVPIIGVNCGHLGFLAEAGDKDIDSVLDEVYAKHYTIEERSLLMVSAKEMTFSILPVALNEITVLKTGMNSMIKQSVRLNGEELYTYVADGLIFATPTGSTAYNLSVGGPMVVPQVDTIIISPIASHSLHTRPLLIPLNWQIDVTVTSRNGNVCISADGRSQVVTTPIDLHITKADYTIKVVQLDGCSFLSSLKSKLNWGGNPIN